MSGEAGRRSSCDPGGRGGAGEQGKKQVASFRPKLWPSSWNPFTKLGHPLLIPFCVALSQAGLGSCPGQWQQEFFEGPDSSWGEVLLLPGGGPPRGSPGELNNLLI